MFAVLLAFLSAASWIPARWLPTEPDSLRLLDGVPVNCLLVESQKLHPRLAERAREKGVQIFAVIRPEMDAVSIAGKAAEAGYSGVVLEGDFPSGVALAVRKVQTGNNFQVIELVPRRTLQFGSGAVVNGTYQGVWPGIEEPKKGEAKAGPTGAPWIFTNGGFLRYAVAVSEAPFWIAHTPPSGQQLKTNAYVQAIGDAAMVGARWVLALQDFYWERLLDGDPEAVAGWKKIAETLRFFEEQRSWGEIQPLSQLAVVQGSESGALYSGGILDMLATKHYPLNVISPKQLDQKKLQGTRIVVNVDASALGPDQADALKIYTRGGGTVFTGPPQAKLPKLEDDDIMVDEEKLKKIDNLWDGVNNMLWQENVGARLFNVSGMLSSLLGVSNGQVLLHLVNYTGYPVENVVAAVKGKFTKAMLYAPGAGPKEVELYQGKGGSMEAEIASVDVVATIRFE